MATHMSAAWAPWSGKWKSRLAKPRSRVGAGRSAGLAGVMCRKNRAWVSVSAQGVLMYVRVLSVR